MTRLFVAVWPPDDVLDQLRSLPRPDTPSVRWSTEDQWHVTLRFLGNVDDVDEVRDALATIELPAADVRVGPATKRLGNGILMLPVHGVDDLAHEVLRVTDEIVPAVERHFTGHLTVARARSRGAIPKSLEGSPFDASWTAPSFALVRSQTKPSGAVYTDVATFALSR
jgi:RNA 2',3'-cyclic 3'-phosphodiesterase